MSQERIRECYNAILVGAEVNSYKLVLPPKVKFHKTISKNHLFRNLQK